MFAKLYEAPERLEQFLNAMSGISAGNFKTFSQKFDFAKYKTLCDVGGATGQLSCMVAAANPHMSCISFHLPKVAPIATRKIEQVGLADRVAAVVTMGMILHDWNLEKKKTLIRKAYDALPEAVDFCLWHQAG